MAQNRFEKRIKLDSNILSKIAKIDEFKGLWTGGASLSPRILSKLKKSVIITSSGASTRIEGAQMNDKEVERLLRGITTQAPKGRDQEENAGYADLLARVLDNYTTLTLSKGHILGWHQIMLKFSQKDKSHRGKYKSADNTVIVKNDKGQEVVLFKPSPPYLVEKEIEEIVNWTNQRLEKKDLHPLLVIANFVFEFLAIHPFLDGNGRLSRVLTNFLLLKSDYTYVAYVSLEEIVEEKQSEYYLALRATQKKHKTKDEDISPWLNYLLDILLVQTERVSKLLDRQIPQKLLSKRQIQVYELFENETLSVAEIDKKLRGEVPQVTIKQSLAKLVDLKLIERRGSGRATRYIKL